jgi:hypothetical protein
MLYKLPELERIKAPLTSLVFLRIGLHWTNQI